MNRVLYKEWMDTDWFGLRVSESDYFRLKAILEESTLSAWYAVHHYHPTSIGTDHTFFFRTEEHLSYVKLQM